MNTLFKNFPIINYNGVPAVNITQSLNMVTKLVANNQVLTPFVMNEPMRSDQLARTQYNDPYMEWLTWMANGIIDPYDWYMNQTQFYNYLNKKYGDSTVCQQKVKYYINNWYSGNPIPVSGYDSLPVELKKYYEPQMNAGGTPFQYVRSQMDWIISTNHIVQFNVANTVVVPAFTDNEIVTVTYAPGVTASGQVCYSGLSGVNIQHVSGNFMFCAKDASAGAVNNMYNSKEEPLNYAGTIIPSAFSIVGSESGSILTITNINQLNISIYDTLLPTEYVYYDPVTIFDDENIKNEARKNMYCLPQSYLGQALNELQNAF